jgi:hypothetical protein
MNTPDHAEAKPGQPVTPAAGQPVTPAVERPVLDEPADEDRPESWGDREGGRDDDWYLRERPPHHG